MFLLGLILLGATGAFTGLLIADNLSGGPEYTVTILGNDIATMSVLGIFLAGLALALIFCLGALLAFGGGARMRRHAGERHRAHAETRQAIAERDALQERLDQPVEPAETAEPNGQVERRAEQSNGQAEQRTARTSAEPANQSASANEAAPANEPAAVNEVPPAWTAPTPDYTSAPDVETDTLPSRRR